MPKTIIKNVAQQIGQLAGEVGETVKKQPGEMAGKVLEQMGVSAGNPQTSQSPVATDEAAAKRQLEERKTKEAVQSQQAAAQISRQLEQEIERLRQAREQQLRQRREVSAAASLPPEAPRVPTSKPSRRFGMWGRRVKSAQDQALPETAGRRVGG